MNIPDYSLDRFRLHHIVLTLHIEYGFFDLEGWISFYYQKRSSKGFSITDGMADGKRKLNMKQLWIKTINPQNSYVLMQGNPAKPTAI